MTAAVRLTALVRGHVQGVGFREWMRRVAESLQLVGSATNLPDGRVEVVAEGSRVACGQLLTALRSSSTPGRVAGVEAEWSDARDEATWFSTG